MKKLTKTLLTLITLTLLLTAITCKEDEVTPTPPPPEDESYKIPPNVLLGEAFTSIKQFEY